MYQNSHRDYDKSFSPEAESKGEQKKVEQYRASELMSLLRNHAREIQEYLDALNKNTTAVEGITVVKTTMWFDTLEDHKELLVQILRGIKQ